MPSSQTKLAILVASALGGALILAWGLHRRGSAGEAVLVDNVAEVNELLASRARGTPPTADRTEEAWPPRLVHWVLDERKARVFYGSLQKQGFHYDPRRTLSRDAGWESSRRFPAHPAGGWTIRTNSLGLREDADPDPASTAPCLVAIGDSQTEGVCANSESYPNQLETELRSLDPSSRTEVWNAGLGGTGPFYYLECLEPMLELHPRVVIATFFGGNDFAGVVALDRYYRKEQSVRGPLKLLDEKGEEVPVPQAVSAAEVGQIAFFGANPEQVRHSIGVVAAIALEMQRICAEREVQFLCVYLPPPWSAQPEVYAAERAAYGALLARQGLSFDLSFAIADEWIELCVAQGLPVLDLRAPIRAVPERIYWEEDLHLDLTGNQLVAQLLLEELQRRGLVGAAQR